MSIFLISCFFWVPTRRQFVTWISLSNYNEVIIITISRLEKPSLFLFFFLFKNVILLLSTQILIKLKNTQNINESHTREKSFWNSLWFWIFYIQLGMITENWGELILQLYIWIAKFINDTLLKWFQRNIFYFKMYCIVLYEFFSKNGINWIFT